MLWETQIRASLSQ
ncbi:hypothetical protein YPPY09_4440, partial [Yersinia pestis PY-09]